MFGSSDHDSQLLALCMEWGSCSSAFLMHREREMERQRRGEGSGGRKTSLNVGCCAIPPRAPLLFLCLGPHVTVGYFLWWLARINRSSNVHPVGQRLPSWWDYSSLISFVVIPTRTWAGQGDGPGSMRNVTYDCRHGTGDCSNVRFV